MTLSTVKNTLILTSRRSKKKKKQVVTKPDVVKVSCPNGTNCKIQSDPSHSDKYAHDKAPIRNDLPAKTEIAKVYCPEGPKCLLMLSGDAHHMNRFNHNGPSSPGSPAPAYTAPALPKCQYGMQCEIAKTSPDHCKKFDHTGVPKPQHGGGSATSPPGGSQKPMCTNPYTCPMTSDFAHKQQFRHYCRNGKTCRNISDPVHQERFVHV